MYQQQKRSTPTVNISRFVKYSSVAMNAEEEGWAGDLPARSLPCQLGCTARPAQSCLLPVPPSAASQCMASAPLDADIWGVLQLSPGISGYTKLVFPWGLCIFFPLIYLIDHCRI